MRRPEPPDLSSLSADQAQWVSEVCNEFEDHWVRTDRPSVQEFMRRAGDDAEPVARLVLLRELLTSELELQQRDTKTCDIDAYRSFFNTPGESDVVDFILGEEARVDGKRRFHVVKLHAQGGLGEVFIAHDRNVDRDVALKRIKPELAADEGSRNRFVREAEITGQLEHPNIAPVYSLGLDGDRLPFYAMRLIEGQPLHEAISDLHKTHARGSERNGRMLALRRFLGKFNDVCDAVAFAHSRGVLHRDIKPANVILGRRFGETILVDWGLAKRIGETESNAVGRPMPHDEFDGTRMTEQGSVLGTLPYMSPEQAQSATGPLSAASDIYSLGATLYHLLTGRPPFVGKDYEELRRKVIEGDFPSPRRVDPAVPRALEAIVLKAMAQKPADRYPTATALAEDIEHWLADEPVSAWREPLAVRTGRRIRQHRTLVLSTAAALFVGVIGLTGFSMVLTGKNRDLGAQRRQAVDQRNRAESEAEIAKAINEFLNKDLLDQASADAQATLDTMPDSELKVRTALDRAAQRIEGKFAGKPLVEASIRRTIGETYHKLGLYAKAQEQLERALDLYRRILRDPATEILETVYALGVLYLAQGKPELAETSLIQARDGFQRLPDSGQRRILRVMVALGDVYQFQGRAVDSERSYKQALDGFRQEFGYDDPDTLNALNNLALSYQVQGKIDEAEPLMTQATEELRRQRGPEHPDTLTATQNLGELYYRRGKLNDAVRLFERVLEVQSRVLGPDHPGTLATKNDLAVSYQDQKRWTEAERMLTESLEGRRRAQGPNHSATLEVMANMATFYHRLGKPTEAEKWLREGLQASQSAYGENSSQSLWMMANLGAVYTRQGKFGEAETLLNNALNAYRKNLGPDHPDTLSAMNQLAILYGAMGKPEKAEPLLKQVLEDSSRRLGPDHPQTLGSTQNMAACYQRVGKLAEAETLYVHLLERRRRLLGDDNTDTLTAMRMLAHCYTAEGKHDQVEPLLVEAVEGFQRVLGAERPETVDVMQDLGVFRRNRQNHAAAESLLRKCLEIRKRTKPDSWQRYGTESELGDCLFEQKKFSEAETLLLSAFRGMKALEESKQPTLKAGLFNAAGRLHKLYEAWGETEKSIEWLTRFEDLVFPDNAFASP